MKIDLLTLFPDMVSPVLQESILRRAQQSGALDIQVHSIRDFAADKHRTTDDLPYGGGPGMVLKPEPIFAAIDQIKLKRGDNLRIIIPSPRGRVFHQGLASELASEIKTLVFICGHYEGIDDRVKHGLNAEEISVGDYVLTGGELAALVIMDAVARLVPGVVGSPQSLEEESFSSHLLEYPQYTRPAEFRGMKVPDVLISGNHEAIRAWRKRAALSITREVRPDLLTSAEPS